MNNISISQAWSYATSFFTGRGQDHAITLIAIGIGIPMALQWLILGNPLENAFNPQAMAGGGGALAAMGVSMVAISVVSYIFSFGSYFTSWRLGFASNEPLGSALPYGLMAGGAFVGILIALVIVGSIIAGAASPWLAVPFFLALAVIFALMFPVWFGFFTICMVLLAAFGSFAMSAILGQAGADAGMGAGVLFVMLAVSVLLLWLAARLSCTAPIMADRRQFLPIDAAKQSWAMTGTSQFKLMGYFLLIGVVLLVLFIILGLMLGGSMQSMMMGGSGPGLGMILGLTVLFTIPMAYFTVAIPAGIYRALGGGSASEVFA